MSDAIQLPKGWGPQGSFLLKVTGDRLVDTHILDGDYVLVHATAALVAGDIVARINKEEQVVVERYVEGVSGIVGVVRGVLRVLRPTP